MRLMLYVNKGKVRVKEFYSEEGLQKYLQYYQVTSDLIYTYSYLSNDLAENNVDIKELLKKKIILIEGDIMEIKEK